MGTYDKEALLRAIWDAPEKILPQLHWQRKGAAWYSRQRPDGTDSNRSDKTILRLSPDGAQIFVNYNGGSFPQGQDIWQLLQWLYNTNDFVEVLQLVGDAYGIQPDMSAYSPEQIERAKQRSSDKAILRDIAEVLYKALSSDEYGAGTLAYLSARNLKTSPRIGAWNTKLRAVIKERLQKKHGKTAAAAADFIDKYFTKFAPDDYQIALPYLNGSGNVIGFALRRTTDEITYKDKQGEQHEKPKYLYSVGMPKGGYCETLRGGDEDVYIVEGQIDAEQMKQHGFGNVLALGGQAPTDNDEDAAKSIVKTLQRYNAKRITYIPDCEYNDDGTRKTTATLATIAALLPHMDDAQGNAGAISSLRIANLQTEDSRRNHTKVDADAFLQMFPPERAEIELRQVLNEAQPWYEFELQNIAEQNAGNPDALAAAAAKVFMQITPAQRGRIKAAVTGAKGGYLAAIRQAGLTAAELALIERDGAQSAWAARMAEVRAKLQAATTRDSVAAVLTEARRAQHADTYAELAAQANLTREDMHALVAEKPDYLQTTWALYKTEFNAASQTWTPRENRKISFAPAAVTIFAAPTNHGKTLLLLQTAINVAQTTGKKFLYISFENDAEQLYIRAIAAYMGKAWDGVTTTDGDGQQHPAMPRAEIRSYIKGDMPATLFDSSKKSIDIGKAIGQYWRTIAPRLALVRMSSDIDAVADSVVAQVEAWRSAGIDVGGVFVDYLQLLHYPALHARSRTDEVKGICDRLNDLAKATKLPVILAAQFNRDATKADGVTFDGVELANIGESSGIENIAEDVYLLWQTDKIRPEAAQYTTGAQGAFKLKPQQYRSRRCFTNPEDGDTLRRGRIYVENLKARDYATGGYCLLPYNGAAGAITSDESEK